MIGHTISHYQVLERLGAGGMGEVYVALDERLERKVALKVLPRELLEDREALARFEREAKAVAALSHPNILGIYDFDRAGEVAFAAMELLEGSTLAERLAGGPLPLSKVLDYGSQIAEGLAAAHERGVVHRDLKPQNLFVTAAGRVKILDFGLAKLSPLGSSADAATATVAEGETEPGKVMGTVGYMSPEQVRGDAVDHRSDVFSLGVVLYQMLTGRRAFAAGSAVETMSAILKEEPPPLAEADTPVPPGLERIVRHCLEKSPGERFQSARDLAFALATVGQETTSGRLAAIADQAPVAARPRSHWRAAGLVAGGVVAGLLLGLALAPDPEPPAAAMHVQTLTFSGTDGSPAISPDGKTVAFVSSRDGKLRIWLKQLEGGGEAPLTDGPDGGPSFAPDGSGILFVRLTEGTSAVYRQPLVGGRARKLVDNAFDADWSPDGERLAFLRQDEDRRSTALFVARPDGSDVRELHRVETFALNEVHWAPAGRRLLALKFVPNSARGSTLLVIDAATGALEEIVPMRAEYTVGSPRWLGDDALLYGQTAALGFQALPSVLVRHELRGGETRELFWAENGGGMGSVAVLPPDRLLFDTLANRQNLDEVELAAPFAERRLTRGETTDRQPVYSPDGRRLLFSSSRTGNLDLWLLELEDGTLQQLTDDASDDWDPAFTPDGEGILWSSNRSGNLEVWTARLDGSGVRQLSHDGFDAQNPTITPDGRWIVYTSGNPERPGIYRMRADGGEATRLVAGIFLIPQISPDGRWAVFFERDGANGRNIIRALAVESGELVDFEVVAPIHEPKGWTQNVGRSRWLPDGSAIVWTGQDAAGRAGLFAQDFDPGRDTTATRRKLAGFDPDLELESFDVSPDGTHIVVSRLEESFAIKLATGVPGLDRP